MCSPKQVVRPILTACSLKGKMTKQTPMNVEQVASMTILADLGGSAAMEWKMIASDGVDAPSALIINPERKVVWRYIGKTDYDNPPTTLIIGNQP